MRRLAPVLAALAAAAALLALYAALGGGRFEPQPVADPCLARDGGTGGGIEAALERIVLSTLDGAACELGVSREDLVLALRDETALEQFSASNGIRRGDAERALSESLAAAIDQSEQTGALPGFVAGLVRSLTERVSPLLLIDVLDRLRGLLT
jgi:hypothetical protein